MKRGRVAWFRVELRLLLWFPYSNFSEAFQIINDVLCCHTSEHDLWQPQVLPSWQVLNSLISLCCRIKEWKSISSFFLFLSIKPSFRLWTYFLIIHFHAFQKGLIPDWLLVVGHWRHWEGWRVVVSTTNYSHGNEVLRFVFHGYEPYMGKAFWCKMLNVFTASIVKWNERRRLLSIPRFE